jgi:hypothetical protein
LHHSICEKWAWAPGGRRSNLGSFELGAPDPMEKFGVKVKIHAEKQHILHEWNGRIVSNMKEFAPSRE